MTIASSVLWSAHQLCPWSPSLVNRKAMPGLSMLELTVHVLEEGHRCTQSPPIGFSSSLSRKNYWFKGIDSISLCGIRHIHFATSL